MTVTRSHVNATDPVISGLLQAKKQSSQAFKAKLISPEIKVDSATGTYFTFGDDFFTGSGSTTPAGGHGMRAIGGSFARLPPSSISSGTFSVHEYGFEVALDDTLERYNEVPTELRLVYAERVYLETMRAQELRVSAVVNATASVTNNTTLTGTAQWSDYANSLPVTNIETGIEAVKKAVAFDAAEHELCVQTNREVMAKLRWHPDLIGKISNNQTQKVGDGELKEFFGFDEIIVCESLRNTAKAGQTASLSYIWGDDFLIFVRAKNPSKMAMGFHHTFALDAIKAEEYREEPRTQVMLVSHMVDDVLVNATGGYLIKDCLA